ncbi:modulator of smoothened protein isoform X1 [Podarcis raffonei]|uniref:modulator of smoothened protein isoform X1 n=1 Tax=Podarcis raffonei TaxID=65483 RepID=UPI002329948E|nr:modulator of smoothened protein isoform X1 [Podarcis raffonei]
MKMQQELHLSPFSGELPNSCIPFSEKSATRQPQRMPALELSATGSSQQSGMQNSPEDESSDMIKTCCQAADDIHGPSATHYQGERLWQAKLEGSRGTAPGIAEDSQSALTVGLVRQCQTIHGRDRTCIPPRLPPEWVTTLFFIIMGIISLTVTCGLLVASHWRREATKYARWIAFTGMILFCMAALIFPIGFYINEVGGQPYKLPNNTVVGSSYVLFVLSIFFTIVGLLFAGKVCLPG